MANVAALLGTREGGVAPLDGGITNRNFKVTMGGTDYVIRLPGKDTNLLGIDRETERIANTAAAGLGIAPKVAATLESPACLITLFVRGRELTADDLKKPEALSEVARALRAFHDSGTELPTTFDSFRVVEDYARIAGERGVTRPSEFEAASKQANAIERAVQDHPEHRPVPCHDDLLSANFLHDGERVLIVDWEYAGMGDRYFDLGNFAVNNELGEADEERLLTEYFGEAPGTRRRATLALFRYMSDFREAMWGVLQTAVSDLDFDFEGYARKHFERLAAAGEGDALAERIEEAGAGGA